MYIHKLNTTQVIHIVADPQYIRQDYVVLQPIDAFHFKLVANEPIFY
jgi:hypothetical protein